MKLSPLVLNLAGIELLIQVAFDRSAPAQANCLKVALIQLRDQDWPVDRVGIHVIPALA